jgi:hypothetical protein
MGSGDRQPRWQGLRMLALAALLAGCSDGGSVPAVAPGAQKAFGEGVAVARLTPAIDAWIAGDSTALSSAIGAIKAESAAAQSIPDWETACTEEAAAARISNLTAILAEGLDEPTVLAMSEMARMDYLDVLGQGKAWNRAWDRREMHLPIEPDCSAADSLVQQHAVTESRLLLAEMLRRRSIWYTELQKKYGSQYSARHLLAADLLRGNGIPSTVYGDD